MFRVFIIVNMMFISFNKSFITYKKKKKFIFAQDISGRFGFLGMLLIMTFFFVHYVFYGDGRLS